MRHLIKSLLLMILFFVYSCSSKEEVNYKDINNYFGVEFTSHFPKEATFPYTLTFSGDVIYHHPSVWLKTSVENKELDSLRTYLSHVSKAIYSSEDSCLLVIDQQSKTDNWIEFDKRNFRSRRTQNRSEECGFELLPVPNFFLEDWQESKYSLTGIVGYIFYVIEAERGEFNNRITLTNSAFAPEGWDHGMSKGVAINMEKKKVIFWVDAW